MKIISLVLTGALAATSLLSAAPRGNSDPEIFASKGGKRDFTRVYPDSVKTIAVITPGSYPSLKSTNAGIELLRKAGYKVKVYPNVFTRPADAKKNPYATIPAELRAKDFEAAWNDLENDMIICARGGTGTENLVAKINWNKLPRRPELYVLGFSDVTMLLAALSAKGYGRPVAGINVASLPGVAPAVIPKMRKMFHGEELSFKLKPLRPGEAEGKVVAGLLSRFVRVVNAGYPLETKGRIIFIESVKGSSESIAKNLDTLHEKGFFKGASALVFGHFVQASDQKNVPGVLKKFVEKLDIPVYSGFPFGHTPRNVSIDFRRSAFIKNNTLTFPAVKSAAAPAEKQSPQK